MIRVQLKYLGFAFVAAGLSLSGCKPSAVSTDADQQTAHAAHGASAGTASAKSDFNAAVQAVADKDKEDGLRVFIVTGDDNMKFGLTRLEVSPGEKFVVILKNIGRQPKEAMGHNWVLLKKDANGRAYCQAAVMARESDYLPPALNSQVLAASKMLGPGEFDRLEITAPNEIGNYPYVCSFPAHYELGMKGVLAVTP